MRGAPDVALLHGLELCQQRAFGDQLVHRADLALDGAVVDQHISVLGPGVEILQRDVDGGQVVAAVRQVGEDIVAARHLDHFGDIIAALAHSGQIIGGDGEERHGFAGGGFIFQRCNALHGVVKDLLGLVSLAQQHAVQLDPLHPGQGAALVAGALHQHRHPEFFQLFLHFGRVVDHRVFDGQAAVGGKNRLIIGRTVLARVGDLAVFHGGFGCIQIPVIGLRAGKRHRIQPIDTDDGVHGGGGHEVNTLDRLL